MKRSEFVKEMAALYCRAGWGDGQAETQAVRDAARNSLERLVTWDPEEPEVLWEGPETGDAWPSRILASGECESRCYGEWKPLDDPALKELARRLLEERRQQEAVDSWNDKQAQAAEREADAIGRTLSVEGSLPGRLEWLNAGNGVDGPVLVEGGTFRLDFSLAKLSPSEERLLRAMVDLWNMWGPEGELRRKLVDFKPVRFEKGGGWLLPDIRQLHSELLASPWSES